MKEIDDNASLAHQLDEARREVAELKTRCQRLTTQLAQKEPSELSPMISSHQEVQNSHWKYSEDLLKIRLELIELSQKVELKEILVFALDKAEAYTDSHISFFHLIDQNQQNIDLQSWSTNTLRANCKNSGIELHYPIDRAGVWVECFYSRQPVIHNDYASLPNKRGLSEGHVLLIRELTVPILRGGLVRAIIGVGNKETDYNAEDVEFVEQIASFTIELIERKQAEEALDEQEAIYRLLAERMADVVWVLDLKTNRFKYVSPSVMRLRGLTPEEVMAAPVEESMTPESYRFILEKLPQQLAAYAAGDISTGVTTTEIQQPHKDGSIIDTEVVTSIVTDALGNMIEIVGVSRDISERKRIAHTLAESQRRLSTLMSNLPGMAYRCKNDQIWTMEFVSEGCLALTGYHPGDLLDNHKLSFASLIHPDDRQMVDDGIQAQLAKKEAFQLNYRIHTVDGTEKWVWEQGVGVFDEQGELQALEGFIQDVTERKRIMADLQVSEEKYRGLIESQESVISTVDFDACFII